MARKVEGLRASATAVAVSLIVVIIAVLFANSTTASRIAENAEDLQWANASLGTAALARAAAGQYTLVVDPVMSGFSASAELDANAELVETTQALERLTESSPRLLEVGLEALVDALESRPVDLAEVERRYRVVRSNLRAEMDRLEVVIAESDEAGARLSAVIRLLVTLILPAAAILVYRRRAANQVREAEVRIAAQLEAEREIARAKDQFVAGMSHELRTPLTGIHGFAEILLDAPPNAEIDRELIAAIHSQSAELRRMVDDFIVASRVQGTGVDFHIIQVDLAGEAEAVAAEFRRYGAHISVTGEPRRAMADRGRLRQVLVNLVSNSVTHGGSNVRIELASDESMVQCAVVDDGPGVAPDVEKRLFTRFVHDSSDAVVQGSLGLGTWVARTLAEAMNGELIYRREASETVFELSLPAARTMLVDADVQMASS